MQSKGSLKKSVFFLLYKKCDDETHTICHILTELITNKHFQNVDDEPPKVDEPPV